MCEENKILLLIIYGAKTYAYFLCCHRMQREECKNNIADDCDAKENSMNARRHGTDVVGTLAICLDPPGQDQIERPPVLCTLARSLLVRWVGAQCVDGGGCIERLQECGVRVRILSLPKQKGISSTFTYAWRMCSGTRKAALKLLMLQLRMRILMTHYQPHPGPSMHVSSSFVGTGHLYMLQSHLFPAVMV